MMNWKQVRILSALLMASGVASSTSMAQSAVKVDGMSQPVLQRVTTPNEPAWGEAVAGLRMRVTAPAGKIYRHRMALPLVLELQNISDKPVPIEGWGLYAGPEVTDAAGRKLMLRRFIMISPWGGRVDSFAPKSLMRWTVRFDQLRFKEPLPVGSKVQMRFRLPMRVVPESPGKTAPLLEVFSNSLELLVQDHHPAKIAGADDLPEKWGKSMNLVYHEDMSIRGYRAMHIDGEGRVQIVRSRFGAPDKLIPSARIETVLSREHLDELATLLRQQKIWELPDVGDRAAIHQTDILMSLASDGSSLFRIIPMSMIKSQPALLALQKEMHRLMAIAVAADSRSEHPVGVRN